MNAAGKYRERLNALRHTMIACLFLSGFLFAINAQQAKAAPQVVTGTDFEAKWDGPAASNRLGEISVGLGDVNGDGVADYAVSLRQNPSYRGIWVLFGPVDSTDPGSFDDLSPEDGYRIRTSLLSSSADNVGDQNGDGIDDLKIQAGGGTQVVIYSVADPATDLSECDGTAGAPVTRCIEISDPRDSNGGRLGFAITSAISISTNWHSGDFDGDGEDEILVSRGPFVLDNGLGSKCDSSPGLCAIDIGTLAAPDVVVFNGPSGVPFGDGGSVPGDTNGDGKDDIALKMGTDGAAQPGVMVIYGKAWDSSPVAVDATPPAADGYKINVPFAVQQSSPVEVGDVNGDGLADVGFSNVSVLPSLSNEYVVVYGREGTPATAPSANPPAPGTGVKYAWDASLGLNSGAPNVASVGDLDGDGGDEFAVGSPGATVDSLSLAGMVVIVNSRVGSNQNEVTLTADSSGSDVLVLGGNAANQQFGSSVIVGGDIDGDGIDDIGVGAQFTVVNGANQAGRFGLLPSSRFYPGAGTGAAASVGTDSADLSGVANANRRESIGYFEYGISDRYGESTDSQSVGSSSAGRGFDSPVTGLVPDTEYHYRAVVVNELGLKAFGSDRTFKTAAVPAERCEQDNTLPGCPGFTGAMFCEQNPSDAICQKVPPTPEVARLGNLIAVPNSNAVRRGNRTQVRAWVTNTGTGAAEGVRICVNVPTRVVAGKQRRCQNIGNVAAGRTVPAQFRIKVRSRARNGARPTLRLTATGQGLGNRTAQVRFRVR